MGLVKDTGSKKYAAVMRLVIGMVFLIVTLPEGAMSHEIKVLTAGCCANDPCADHHCPVDGSEPIHHCPQCCTFSHSFTDESCQSISFIVPDDCGMATVFEHTTISNLLPDTIFHPPENLHQ